MTMRDRHYHFLAICLAASIGISVSTPAPLFALAVNQNRDVKPQFRSLLEFRIQTEGTNDEFTTLNQLLQALLQQREALEIRKDSNAIAKHQAILKQVYEEISLLFSGTKFDERDIAEVSIQGFDNRWGIAIAYTNEGSKKFAKITKELAGTGRSLGIFYEGKLISAPTVNSQFSKTGIIGESSVIEANLTILEAVRLSEKLNKRATIRIAQKADRLVYSASNLVEKKDFTGAISKLDKAIKLDPKNVRAYTFRGKTKASMQKWIDAIADYNKALTLQPNSIDAYQNRAKAKHILKDYIGSIADYRFLQKIRPGSTSYYYHQLMANYLLTNRKQDAIALVEDTFVNGFEFKLYQEWHKAIALIRFQDYLGAITQLDKAINIKPNFGGFYLLKGVAYERRGDSKKAILEYQKVIDLKPEAALPQELNLNFLNNEVPNSSIRSDRDRLLSHAYLSRGAAYSKLENWEAARQDLDKAIALSASNASAQQLRSLVRQKLKDEAGAEKDAREAARFFAGTGEIALPL